MDTTEDKLLHHISPFHFLLDDHLKIVSIGDGLKKLTGDIRNKHFSEIFSFIRPKLQLTSPEAIDFQLNQLVILKVKDNEIVKLRGEFIRHHTNILFIGSIWVNTLNEFVQTGLKISDLPHHDSLIELLQIIQGQQIINTDVKSLMIKLQEQKNQIQKRETKYKELLSNLYDGVINFDADGKIVECNKAISSITGYSEEELLTLQSKDITYEEDWPKARAAAELLKAKGYLNGLRLRCLRKDGQLIDIEISSTAILENGIYKGSRDIIRDITERKKIEEQLRDLSLVAAETSNLVIICDENRTVQRVNKSFCTISGFEENEVIGKDLLPLIQGDLFDTDLLNKVNAEFDKGKPFIGTIVAYDKKKQALNMEIEIIPVKNAAEGIEKYIIIATDVTDKIKKNEQLRESELKWKFALEGTGDGIWEYHVNNSAYAVSNNLKNQFGLDQSSNIITDQELMKLIHPDDLEKASKNFLSLIKGKEELLNHEFRVVKPDGTFVWILSRGIITKKDPFGNTLTALGTTTDITANKEAELELAIAKNHAEKASEYKNQFLSTMSHEIRTPLNAIIGLTDILKKSVAKKELLEDLNTLSFSANHLLSLINDVLDFSKIESGKLEFIGTNFNLRNTVNAIHQSFIQSAKEKGLSLNMVVDAKLPEILYGDETRLTQILNNLINNAIKFTANGKIQVHLFIRQIKKSTVRIGFEVADTGIGIPKAMQKRIFDDYVQVSPATFSKYGGTGLGLSITKKLIELQGGKISIKSKVGEGTTFEFYIPYEFPVQSEQGNLTSSAYDAHGLKNLRILLAEDIAVNRKVALSYLHAWGVKTDVAVNGREAIALYKQKEYDLILIDLYMPVMNGFTAIKKIKAVKEKNKIPVIALTASADTATINKVLEIGADACIVKPIDQRVLFNTISKFSGRDVSFKIETSNTNHSPKNKLKYIGIKRIEEASLGSKSFISEMLVLLEKEISETIGQAKKQLKEADYTSFSKTIHKLKNSMLMFEMDDLRETLIQLEARKKLKQLPDLFKTVEDRWKKASKEIKTVKSLYEN